MKETPTSHPHMHWRRHAWSNERLINLTQARRLQFHPAGEAEPLLALFILTNMGRILFTSTGPWGAFGDPYELSISTKCPVKQDESQVEARFKVSSGYVRPGRGRDLPPSPLYLFMVISPVYSTLRIAAKIKIYTHILCLLYTKQCLWFQAASAVRERQDEAVFSKRQLSVQ